MVNNIELSEIGIRYVVIHISQLSRHFQKNRGFRPYSPFVSTVDVKKRGIAQGLTIECLY